jgi:hypothetical protein
VRSLIRKVTSPDVRKVKILKYFVLQPAFSEMQEKVVYSSAQCISSKTSHTAAEFPNIAVMRYFCFVFQRSQVKMSVWRPDILTKVFSSFPQSFQANYGTVP